MGNIRGQSRKIYKSDVYVIKELCISDPDMHTDSLWDGGYSGGGGIIIEEC